MILILQKARIPEAVSFNIRSYPSAFPEEAIQLLKMALLTLKIARSPGDPRNHGDPLQQRVSELLSLARVGSACSGGAVSIALLRTNLPSSQHAWKLR